MIAAKFPEISFKTASGYECRPITVDHWAVKLLRSKFFQKFNIPEDIPNPNLSWFGIFINNEIQLVFAIGVRSDGGVEGTDFYAAPTREGAKAAAWALFVSTQIIDAGIAPYFYMWVLGNNTAMHKRLERAFKVKGPASVMYKYVKNG